MEPITTPEPANGARTIPRSPPTYEIVASTVALSAIAVAQPVLDVLSRNAQFFVARDAPTLDIVLLALSVALVGPLGLAAIIIGVRTLNRRAGTIAHLVVIGALVATLVLQPLKRMIEGRGVVLVLVSLALGAASAFAYSRRKALRNVVMVLAPLALIVAALFLFTGQVSRLVFPRDGGTSVGVAGKPVPIVFLVLDEFPVASLMDRSGAIDARAYPHLARLGKEGTWYRNAASMHDFTEKSVASMLSSVSPDNKKLPVVTDYPVNLFTLLGDSYRFHVVEAVTQLCPEKLCPPPARARAKPRSMLGRWKAMASDVRWISLHVLLPKDLTGSFPAIDQQWGAFDAKGGAAPTRRAPMRSRPQIVSAFTEGLRPSERPTIHFLHSMFPHPPWTYLRSGQSYPATGTGPGRAQGRYWVNDQWLANLSLQRHLEMVRYTDSLVGTVISKLKSEGLYDDTMLVVTSDHGAAFNGRLSRREFFPQTAGGIAAVPLFIKYPAQREGGVDDRPAQSIDILPTIAEVIGISRQDGWEGISLLREDFPKLRERKILTNRGETFSLSSGGREKFEVVRAAYRLFGVSGGSIDPFAMGPYRALVGTRARAASSSVVRVCTDGAAAYRSIDPKGKEVPALLTAKVSSSGRRWIGVVVNGIVRSVTRTFFEEGAWRIDAFVGAHGYRSGINEISFLEVRGSPGDPQVTRLTAAC